MSATARLGFVPKDHSALRGDSTGTALADQAPTASDTSLPDPAVEQAAGPDPLAAVVEARLANAVAEVHYISACTLATLPFSLEEKKVQ